MKHSDLFGTSGYLLVSLLVVWVFQSCMAPVFSEIQNARTVEEKKIEITPSYTAVHFSEDGETEFGQNHLGVQLTYGVSPKTDIRLRYERAWLEDDMEYGFDWIGVAMKTSLLEDRIAVSIPLWVRPSLLLGPSLIFTFPASQDKVDLTVAPKYLFSPAAISEGLVAINFGAALSPDLRKWSVRPEYGLLFNPTEGGHYGQLSIGFSATLGK